MGPLIGFLTIQPANSFFVLQKIIQSSIIVRMHGVELILVAAIFVATSNLCMRRSIDSGGTTKAFLMIQLFLVFLVAILLNPVKSGDYHWSSSMASFGFGGGLILALMMAALGRALETGPPGLTFAALNASTVMPTILMVLLFGSSFGYSYTLWNAVGSFLVVLGLFWAGWSIPKVAENLDLGPNTGDVEIVPAAGAFASALNQIFSHFRYRTRLNQKSNWLAYITAAFALHVIFLVFLSWRALFINFPDASGLLLSFDMEDASSQWFMPMAFLAAFLVQAIIYFITEKRAPHSQELLYGVLGGIANGVGTFFMIRATEVATPLEHAVIYPLFAVTIIILCNLWGQWLYQERVNWKANAICVFGLLIGTLNWKVLLG